MADNTVWDDALTRALFGDSGVLAEADVMNCMPELTTLSVLDAVDLDLQFDQADPYLFEASTNGILQPATNLSSHSSDEGIGMSPVAMANVLGSPSNSVTLADEDDQDMVEELLRGIANETVMTAPVGLPEDFSMTCEDAQDLLNQLQGMPPTPVANNVTTLQIEDSTSSSSSSEVVPVPSPAVSDEGDGKCYVCKEQAGKHNYYGGNVCPSCRAFFRRSVQSKYYEIFFCAKGETCEISLKTRRSCQFCRFKKCLESGMRVAWVLPDGERNKRFNKINKAAGYRNRLASTSSIGSSTKDVDTLASMNQRQQAMTVVPVSKAPADNSLTPDEMALITQTHATVMSNKCCALDEYVNANQSFFKDLVTISYFGGHVSQFLYKSCNKMFDKFTSDVMLSLDDFRTLPASDQRQLLDVNGQMMSRLKSAMSMKLKEEEVCMSKGIECMVKSSKYSFLDEINERLSSLELESKKPSLEYSQFFSSPWAASYEDEQKHFDLMCKMSAWPRDTPTGTPDQLLLTLLNLILAFTPDYVQLKRRDVVERNQLKYVILMQKYLKFKYGAAANAKFAQGLMMTSYAREVDLIQKRRLPVY